MYADYSFYVSDFFGTLIAEGDFLRLSARASDFLDYFTRGKAALSEHTEELAKACCAIAEAMLQDEQQKQLAAKAASTALAGNGEVKSETVGSWSQSYATSADYAGNRIDAIKSSNSVYAWIATQYLLNTGLLYRGGR